MIGVFGGQPQSSARVDFVIANNATWNDGLQFDPPCGPNGNQSEGWPWWLWGTGCTGGATTGPTGWSFTGYGFRLDVKPNLEATGPSLSLSATAGSIVVDDYQNRVLHFNVSPTAIQDALIPGVYLYDMLMEGNGVVVQLAHGTIKVTEGISEIA